MIDPLQQQEVAIRGAGLGFLPGDESLGIPMMPGDLPPRLLYSPGSRRFAGDKIKGLEQLDPTIFAKLFA